MHADDFGLSPGTNEAIVDAHLQGVVTSTSVIATLPSFEDAARRITEVPELGIGAHLCLNLGHPVAPPSRVGLLLDENGLLNDSYAFHLYRSLSQKYLDQVAVEVEAQLMKMAGRGINLDHVSSQMHIHMIPRIRDVVMEISEEFRIPHVRHAVEPWTGHPNLGRPVNLLKCLTVAGFASLRPRLQSEVKFLGLRHSGRLTVERLEHYFSILKPGIWEIVVHPGTGWFDGDPNIYGPIGDYMRLKHRRIEWNALTSTRLNTVAEALGIEFVRFSDI